MPHMCFYHIRTSEVTLFLLLCHYNIMLWFCLFRLMFYKLISTLVANSRKRRKGKINVKIEWSTSKRAEDKFLPGFYLTYFVKTIKISSAFSLSIVNLKYTSNRCWICVKSKMSFMRGLMYFENGAEILRFESYVEYSTLLIPG